jgi:hypothetical protein
VNSLFSFVSLYIELSLESSTDVHCSDHACLLLDLRLFMQKVHHALSSITDCLRHMGLV